MSINGPAGPYGSENRLTKKYLTHIIRKDFYVES